MMQVVLSTRGRFTLPIEMRRALRLKAGDYVHLEDKGRKGIVITRAKAERKARED
jgi:AbrB family looped-hinge helix DNA binding protein